MMVNNFLNILRFLTFIFIFKLCVTSLAAEASIASFSDALEDVNLNTARPWRAPDYTNQDEALGYSVSAFSIPPGMEERTSFWIDIYTKYSTNEGLIHDSLYVHLVYEVVDFNPIMKNITLSDREKRKQRRLLLKNKKKEVIARLKKLHRLSSPAGLEGEDLRYWYMFAKVDEKRKFLNATQRNRLRFQLGQSNRFYKGIYLSGRHIEKMEEIFKDNGLPIELTRLPFVESSFNYKARSKVGASGIWQFMRYTGRRFLKMNASVDERNDPIKATEAAARMLKINYNMLESWPLAVTGYNHGPAGVRRLVKRYQTRSLGELVENRRGRFGFASANFYASFLAALIVEKSADQFFKTVFWKQPLKGKEIQLKKTVSKKQVLDWFDGDLLKAQEFNPHFKRNVWQNYVNISRKNFVRVPEEKFEQATKDMDSLKSLPLYMGDSYKVARGDTMSSIAYHFGVSLRKLKQANAHINPRRMQIGQKLFIPKR